MKEHLRVARLAKHLRRGTKGVSTWFTKPAVSPELHFVQLRRFSVLPVGRPLTAQRSQRPALVSKPMHGTNPCRKWPATSPPSGWPPTPAHIRAEPACAGLRPACHKNGRHPRSPGLVRK